MCIRDSFSDGKAKHETDQSPPCSTEVCKRMELSRLSYTYLYSEWVLILKYHGENITGYCTELKHNCSMF
jgi:hypothetical protein